MSHLLITSYTNPDIDGFACSYAYSEFLNKSWIENDFYLFWTPHKEVSFILDRFWIDFKNTFINIQNYDKFILTDLSEKISIPAWIHIENVIEVIDHRKYNDSKEFTNAKIQIELVGSCATLITEKFFYNKINISRESWILLYMAIISNTINLTNNVTTTRDRDMANYLKSLFVIDENIIDEIFTLKSSLEIWDLKESFLSDIKSIEFAWWKLSIIQMEILNSKDIIHNYFEDILKILSDIKKEKQANYIFLTFVDIWENINYIVCNDKEIIHLLEKGLNITFENFIWKTNKIFMRKEIIPIITSI